MRSCRELVGLAWWLALVCVLPIRGGLAETPRPNVLILVADDLGFSDLGCYGSEIATPVLDSLAANGVLFTDFHAAPTCSPTRAMLLTGVDHHRAGMGNMYEFLRSSPEQIGRPGYEGHLNASVVTIAELLRTAGYHTAIAGKWHLGLSPVMSQAPIGRGFDQSWVLWSGWAEHVMPAPARFFVDGKARVNYPLGTYSTDFYTTKAIEFADAAIDQGKPFFLYASYTAPHWPLEAPRELIDKQKGKYNAGYDALRKERTASLIRKGILPAGVQVSATPRIRPQLHHLPASDPLPPWSELNAEDRAYSARMMEVYAAMIESLDQNIGRLLEHLRSREQFDNTFILFLSDNGAAPMASMSDEPSNAMSNVGSPGSFVGYGPEWAQACSGPLRLTKGYATEGGTRVPVIIKLPKRQQSQQSRVDTSFASVLDIAPTIYELAGVAYPNSFQEHALHPLDGASLLPHLLNEQIPIHEPGFAMGWELFGRSAFRQGKWKVTWTEQPFGPSNFELFDIAADPGESHDLQMTNREVYERMVEGWKKYAKDYGVILVRPSFWEAN